MNTYEALQAIREQAAELEQRRRQLIRTAIEAHLDHGVGANTIATTLGSASGGPGWGRDRVLAYLAAARTARTANRAIEQAGLGNYVLVLDDDSDIGDTMPGAPRPVASLATWPGQPIDRDTVTQILAALAAAGLTIDIDDTQRLIAELDGVFDDLPIKPIPRP